MTVPRLLRPRRGPLRPALHAIPCIVILLSLLLTPIQTQEGPDSKFIKKMKYLFLVKTFKKYLVYMLNKIFIA